MFTWTNSVLYFKYGRRHAIHGSQPFSARCTVLHSSRYDRMAIPLTKVRLFHVAALGVILLLPAIDFIVLASR